jgi:hypothetical protein
MGTPWELDGNTLVTAYKIWKLTYGVLHHKGGNGDMYCYVLEWDGGLKSQLTGVFQQVLELA